MPATATNPKSITLLQIAAYTLAFQSIASVVHPFGQPEISGIVFSISVFVACLLVILSVRKRSQRI